MIKQAQNPKKYSGIYNIGPKNMAVKKVKDLVKIFSKNFKFKYKFQKKNILNETKILRLNINKSKKKLNFSSKLNFEKSINLTISWYRNFLDNKNMINISENQIKYYYKK